MVINIPKKNKKEKLALKKIRIRIKQLKNEITKGKKRKKRIKINEAISYL